MKALMKKFAFAAVVVAMVMLVAFPAIFTSRLSANIKRLMNKRSFFNWFNNCLDRKISRGV